MKNCGDALLQNVGWKKRVNRYCNTKLFYMKQRILNKGLLVIICMFIGTAQATKGEVPLGDSVMRKSYIELKPLGNSKALNRELASHLAGSQKKPILIDDENIKSLNDVRDFQKGYCEKYYPECRIIVSDPGIGIYNAKLLYYVFIKKADVEPLIVIYFDPTVCFNRLKEDAKVAGQITKLKNEAEAIRLMTILPLKPNALGTKENPVIIKGVKNLAEVDEFRHKYCKIHYKDGKLDSPLVESINGKFFYTESVQTNQGIVKIVFDASSCFRLLKKSSKKLESEILSLEAAPSDFLESQLSDDVSANEVEEIPKGTSGSESDAAGKQ